MTPLAPIQAVVIAWRALSWSARSCLSKRTWPPLALSVIAPAAVFPFGDDYWWLLILVSAAVLVSTMLLPLGLVRPSVVSGQVAQQWWRIQWPGFPTLGLAVILFVAGSVTSRVPFDRSLWGILGWLLAIVVGALPEYMGMVVLFSRRPSLVVARSTFTLSFLVAWYAFYAMVFVPGLLLAWAVTSVRHFTPLLVSAHASDVPNGWAFALAVSKTIGVFWWLFLLPPTFLVLAGQARLLWLLGISTSDEAAV